MISECCNKTCNFKKIKYIYIYIYIYMLSALKRTLQTNIFLNCPFRPSNCLNLYSLLNKIILNSKIKSLWDMPCYSCFSVWIPQYKWSDAFSYKCLMQHVIWAPFFFFFFLKKSRAGEKYKYLWLQNVAQKWETSLKLDVIQNESQFISATLKKKKNACYFVCVCVCMYVCMYVIYIILWMYWSLCFGFRYQTLSAVKLKKKVV